MLQAGLSEVNLPFTCHLQALDSLDLWSQISLRVSNADLTFHRADYETPLMLWLHSLELEIGHCCPSIALFLVCGCCPFFPPSSHMGHPLRHLHRTSRMGFLAMSSGSCAAKAAVWYLFSTRDLGPTQPGDGILPGAQGSKMVLSS